jgi:hypothetical protein
MRLSAAALATVILFLGLTAFVGFGQKPRQYRDGSVWNVFFIHIKDGMSARYLEYVAKDWRREQAELKRQGLVLSYKVLTTESHDARDWNCMLMTEYRNLAALEAERAKRDAVIQRLNGDEEEQAAGFKRRIEIREVVGVRVAREIAFDDQD